jgi:hypothetical protein
VATKQVTFRVRASEEEVAAWKAAAAREGVSASEWIRRRANGVPPLAEDLAMQTFETGVRVEPAEPVSRLAVFDRLGGPTKVSGPDPRGGRAR